LEVNTAAILGYVITILLIPMVIYIWMQNQKRGDKMEERVESLEERITKCEVDAQETKTNYTQKFSELREQINDKFRESAEIQTNIQVSIGEIKTSLVMLINNKKEK
jgi:biopolymer transport protein ExbB/TolQ